MCTGFDAAATKKCFSMARKVLLTLRINYENYRKHIRYQLLPVVNRPDPSKHSENQTIMIKVKAIFAALALAALLSSSAKAAAISTDLKENSVIDGAVSTVNPEHPTVVKVVPQASGDSYISQRWVKLQSVQSGLSQTSPSNGITPIPELSSFFPVVGILAAIGSSTFLRRRRAAKLSV